MDRKSRLHAIQVRASNGEEALPVVEPMSLMLFVILGMSNKHTMAAGAGLSDYPVQNSQIKLQNSHGTMSREFVTLR